MLVTSVDGCFVHCLSTGMSPYKCCKFIIAVYVFIDYLTL